MLACQELMLKLFTYSNFSFLLDPFHRNLNTFKAFPSSIEKTPNKTKQTPWTHTSTLDFSLSRITVVHVFPPRSTAHIILASL